MRIQSPAPHPALRRSQIVEDMICIPNMKEKELSLHVLQG